MSSRSPLRLLSDVTGGLDADRRATRESTPARQLLLIAAATVLAMALWFSASAVSAEIQAEWRLGAWGRSLLTSSVQLGFVCGAVGSAALALPDRVDPRRLFAASAALGSLATTAMAAFSEGLVTGVALRFMTGVVLAGVYPVGLKLMASWFLQGRSWAMGVSVGALTLGSSLPYLIASYADVDWEVVLNAASVLGLAAALLTWLFVREGPHVGRRAAFDPRYLRRMLHDRRQRLINIGYFGHMWELYALWAHLPTFLVASFVARTGEPPGRSIAGVLSFAVIGVAGLLGCLIGGRVAGTRGPVAVARVALAVSGACCALSPLVFGAHPLLLTAFAMVWGASVIADSPQFSAALSLAAEPSYLGTALSLQTALGFALTTVTIQGMPVLAGEMGWRYSLVFLALGPAVGLQALSRLVRRP